MNGIPRPLANPIKADPMIAPRQPPSNNNDKYPPKNNTIQILLKSQMVLLKVCFAQSVSLLNDKDVLSDALRLLTYIRSIHPL